MGLATIDPHSHKCRQFYKIPKFGENALPDSHTFFTISNGWILLTIASIYTKLWDFVKLSLHFMTMWINSCKSHNLDLYLVLLHMKSGNPSVGRTGGYLKNLLNPGPSTTI